MAQYRDSSGIVGIQKRFENDPKSKGTCSFIHQTILVLIKFCKINENQN